MLTSSCIHYNPPHLGLRKDDSKEFPSWEAQGYFLNTKRSGRKFLVVYLAFMTYLIITSFIYSAIELGEEDTDRATRQALLSELSEYNISSSLYEDLNEIVTEYYEDNWEFSGALMFSFSLYSTTGFSSFTPTNSTSRVICMILGLPGICLCYLTIGSFVNFILRNLGF